MVVKLKYSNDQDLAQLYQMEKIKHSIGYHNPAHG